MKNILSQLLVSGVIGSFLLSCAHQVALTGGKKDELPPKRLATDPDNITRDFKEDQVEISFDELIQLQDVGSIYISPITDKAPLITTVGKSLRIKFLEPLDTGTTYSIHFGKSIVDYHEGNPLENHVEIINTGKTLDTIRYTGRVLNLKDRNPIENIVVGLYKSATFMIDSIKPTYISKTSDKGTFEFQNVKKNTYFLRALDDKNKDFKLQMNEKFAFISEKIVLDGSLDSVDLLLSENRDTRIIAEFWRGNTRFPAVVFSKPVPKGGIAIKDSLGKAIKHVWNFGRDTAFFRGEYLKSVLIVGDDTLRILAKKILKVEGEEKLTLKTPKIMSNRILVQSKGSIVSFEKSGFFLSQDSQKYTVDSVTLTNRNTLAVYFVRPKKINSIRLTIDSAAVQYKSKKVNLPFAGAVAFEPKENLGMLGFKLPISQTKKSYTISLLDDKDVLVRSKYVASASGGSTVVFKNLEPGDYSLLLHTDINGNRIWDGVQISPLLQPEPISKTGIYRLEKGWELLDNQL